MAIIAPLSMIKKRPTKDEVKLEPDQKVAVKAKVEENPPKEVNLVKDLQKVAPHGERLHLVRTTVHPAEILKQGIAQKVKTALTGIHQFVAFSS